MKKLTILLLILLASCSTKTTNILNVNVDNSIYEVISKDTVELIKNNININNSNIIINSKQNNFLNILEQTLRIAGYSVFVSTEHIMLKQDDYNLNYIVDVIKKTKVEKNKVITVRYSLSLKDKSCSKLYEINNNNEILYKSEWYCLGE